MISEKKYFPELPSGIIYFLFVPLAIFFLLLKFKTLSLPYFWDEAWVYAPALKKMSLHPGILPSSLEDSYSRGHPLLFHFLGGIWVKVFGTSNYSLHSFALTISITFLFSLLYIGKKMVGNFFGLSLMLLTASQDLFFGQSALVLPEVFLALGVLWSFYFFAKNKTVPYIIFSSLLVLIKEQGALLIFSFCLWSVLENIFRTGIRSLFTKAFIIKLFCTASPVLILLLFLGIQKLQRGYMFFPSHIDMIKLEWNYIVWNLRLAFDILFLQSGKEILGYIFLIVFLFFSKKIFFWRRLLSVVLLYVVLKLSFGEWNAPLWFALLLGSIAICLIVYLLQLSAPKSKEPRGAEDPRGPILIFLLVFGFFASFNFFCNRYLLCLFPLILFYFLYEIFKAFQKEKTILFILVPVMILFSAYKTMKNDAVNDCSANYTNGINVYQDLIRFSKDHDLGSRKILASFVMYANMSDPAIGFVKAKSDFTNVSNGLDTTDLPEFVLVTNFDGSPEINAALATGKYQPLQDFKHGKAEGTFFMLKTLAPH